MSSGHGQRVEQMGWLRSPAPISTTRERSSKYVSLLAPTMMPSAPSYCTATYLPKRDELSLRMVLALPKASSTGDASRSST